MINDDLVGGFNLPLWKMMDWKSVGVMTFPIWWESQSKFHGSSQHQPAMVQWSIIMFLWNGWKNFAHVPHFQKNTSKKKWWWKSDPSTEVQKAGKIHRSAAVGCPARWLIAGGYHALHWVIKTWLSTISYDYHKFSGSLVDYLSIMSLVDYPLVN